MTDKKDPGRIAEATLDPYPHDVTISARGTVLARTRAALLLRETFAPEICVPEADVRTDLLKPGTARGRARVFHADLDETLPDIARRFDDPADMPELKGRYAFDFDKVTIEVDGQQVRGHVRDPRKIITVAPLGARLQMEIEGQTIVDSARALVLRETGLPDRFYVPAGDVDETCLVPSDRRSVCTYKGEATYHHVEVAGHSADNAVWTYDDPWTDFSADIGRIKGHRGLFTSAFDRILLDGQEREPPREEIETDRWMQDRPTVDRTLREKT
jgi:uncharacterized protein (DUF427 family)